MSNVVEKTVDFHHLFKFLEHKLGKIFQYEESNLVDQLGLQIKNENNEWCDVPAVVKKRSNLVELSFDNGDSIKCADKHLLRTINTECKYAEDFSIGDTITKANDDKVECVSKRNLGEEDVYDLQIDSDSHLYQISNGIVNHNTLIVRKLAEYIDVPLAIADATSLTESGLTKLTAPFYRNVNRIISLIAGNSLWDNQQPSFV